MCEVSVAVKAVWRRQLSFCAGVKYRAPLIDTSHTRMCLTPPHSLPTPPPHSLEFLRHARAPTSAHSTGFFVIRVCVSSSSSSWCASCLGSFLVGVHGKKATADATTRGRKKAAAKKAKEETQAMRRAVPEEHRAYGVTILRNSTRQSHRRRALPAERRE